MQSDALYRQQPGDLTRLYTRSNQSNKMVPLSALVSTSWTAGPDILPHFNGFPAAKIIGSAAPGYSSGQAIAAMEDVARELPPGYTFAWSGLAFEEKTVRRHLVAGLRVRPDHRLPGAGGAVRVVDACPAR